MRKALRIKDNDEFQRIFKEGRSFANRQLVIYFLRDAQETKTLNRPFRVGLSVGKKIGNAVTRNRIKRYLRESFMALEEQIIPNVDIIIIARQPTKEMGLAEMKKSLVHLLSRQQLLLKK